MNERYGNVSDNVSDADIKAFEIESNEEARAMKKVLREEDESAFGFGVEVH